MGKIGYCKRRMFVFFLYRDDEMDMLQERRDDKCVQNFDAETCLLTSTCATEEKMGG